ncbi:MAG: cytochrome c family protein [Pseudomonadota bacterium]
MIDGYELNKFMGAITGALAVFLALVIFSESMFHHSHGDHHGEPKFYYASAVDAAPVEEVVEEVIPLAVLVAEASLASGERVFKKCASCHKIDAGSGNGVGPSLHGVMGRTIAANDGFSYSSALADKGGVWDWEAMNAFLTKPKEWAPGTKMNFAGLKKEKDRAAVMVYMNAQSEAPLATPVAEVAQ